MNNIVLQGRLGKDPEVRYAQNGNGSTAIARFNLAVKNNFRKKEGDQEPRPDWIPCVAFGKQAEFAEKYLSQGKPILVQGRLESGSYKNKDGQTVYTLEVIVERFEFPETDGGRSGNADRTSASAEPKPAAAAAAPPAQAAAKQEAVPVQEEFVPVPEEEELPWN